MYTCRILMGRMVIVYIGCALNVYYSILVKVPRMKNTGRVYAL